MPVSPKLARKAVLAKPPYSAAQAKLIYELSIIIFSKTIALICLDSYIIAL